MTEEAFCFPSTKCASSRWAVESVDDCGNRNLGKGSWPPNSEVWCNNTQRGSGAIVHLTDVYVLRWVRTAASGELYVANGN